MPLRVLCLSPLPSPSLQPQTQASWSDSTAPEVADVVSGGHWSADGKGGFYRALAVMAGEKAAIANVYLQWLSFGDAAKPTVVKSVPVKEINDQNLGNPSIEIGGEEDRENEATIFVSSYDVEEDKGISLLIKVTKPGTYTVAKAPPQGPEQGSGERERLKPALQVARLRPRAKSPEWKTNRHHCVIF